ncbi:hypothetical protein BT93_L2062 [Corymbia citriodora subsp. variegata]|uniref:Uncharacterized protein n=1 Tax=Corymbia citriodora subsp. variegata TaxID=360336 RepID=A0A8T0CNJ7_CORYI|nr:hypothetical protein BT93_L2062 [Corymbia citriodora subsp. variegata]
MMKIKILHRHDVSPPANTVPPTALPLTFFDIPWLFCCPMQRLFFYDFPQSPSSFAHTTLPLLVRSLSLCLRRFFPFAGRLVLPQAPPQKPHILYSDGDSLSFTFAESSADFAELIIDEPRDATLIHPLVPQFPPPRESNGARLWPLMAIQVTLFPNKGICIGVRFLHIATDGRSLSHFMQSWASIHRSGGDPTCIELGDLDPFHDRGVIKDLNGLEPMFLKYWWSRVGSSPSPCLFSEVPLAVGDKVRATFVIKKAHIDGLKAQVLSQLKNNDIDSMLEPIHLSTFVVTCAFVWVCMIKSKEKEHELHDQSSSESVKDKLCYFGFPVDCRNRLAYSIPLTYFGNCLDLHYLSKKRNVLLDISGIAHATRAIGRAVKEVNTRGGSIALREWIKDHKEINFEDLVVVAGSPRLKVYDTDFGWGRPTKSNVVCMDSLGGIALTESRNGNGGIEVELALTRTCMEKFITLFEMGLKSIM